MFHEITLILSFFILFEWIYVSFGLKCELVPQKFKIWGRILEVWTSGSPPSLVGRMFLRDRHRGYIIYYEGGIIISSKVIRKIHCGGEVKSKPL